MNKEEYKFDHFKDIDEVMHYFNYWYKEDDVFAIDRYLSLEDFDYISNKYQDLQQERDKYKSIVDKAIKYIEETPIGRILPVHYWQEKDYTEPLLKILKELEEGDNNA